MMNAPQIPNLLNTLRASRGSRSARNRHNVVSTGEYVDLVVQQTDDDAAGSRLSALEAGYLHDDFARAFSTSNEIVRRMPIINRGTFVRTRTIDRLVRDFLNLHRNESTQIISLGAGTDTRYFRLIQEEPSLAGALQYHEIDFPSTASKKIKAIESTHFILSLLQSTLGAASKNSTAKSLLEISADKTSLSSPSYSIHALDLRDLASPSPPQLSVSRTSATLIISECCLTYLQPSISQTILTHFTSKVLPSTTFLQIILYEPLHPHDAFGRRMVTNLSTRAISMPGLEAYPTLETHKQRLQDVGFRHIQEGWEVKEIWDQWITPEEKETLRGLELVDEEEEWNLLAGHYGFIRGIRNGGALNEEEKTSRD